MTYPRWSQTLFIIFMPKDNHRKKTVVPEPPKLDRDEKNQKIKELIKLAKEQGYLTYGDLNDVLPENILSPEELDPS